jgi:hypothetical protein
VGKPLGIYLLGKPRMRLEGNIKMDLRKTVCEDRVLELWIMSSDGLWY